MTAPAAAGFVIAAAQSAEFARLSGDFNPLHVDALAARRLQFGDTVCHGVHLVLNALEALARQGVLAGRSLRSVSAVFHQPVRTGTQVLLTHTADAASQRHKIVGSVEGRAQFTAQLVLGDSSAAVAVAESAPEEAVAALCPEFPGGDEAARALAGTVPLRVNGALLESLFPALAAWPEGRAVAADLMASTRVVGMRLPGRHSIYSEFKLQRRDAPAAAAAMTYNVAKVDPRFRKLRVQLQGGLFEGHFEAFFRAPPVAQRSLAEVATLTAPGCTAGQKALVIGGSRGLGELVAKMLLAGGAEVTLSYARGRDDAERTVAEAATADARCTALQIDAGAALPAETAAAIAAAGYTHLYHFATPAIGKSVGGAWSAPLYESYCRVYVTGLAELARAAVAGERGSTPLHVFYPSTVFLDHAEKGFAEYCAAKAAGETLCDHLALEPARYRVQRPRLPRMKTDQNSSFLGPEADDPYPVMATLLQAFCGYRTRTAA